MAELDDKLEKQRDEVVKKIIQSVDQSFQTTIKGLDTKIQTIIDNSNEDIKRKINELSKKERRRFRILEYTVIAALVTVIGGFLLARYTLKSQEKILITTTVLNGRPSQRLAETMSKLCPLLTIKSNREDCFRQIDSLSISGTIFLHGRAIDSYTKRPIQSVSIINDYDKTIVQTDENGAFLLIIDSKNSADVGLVLYKMGYLNESFSTKTEGFFQEIVVPMKKKTSK